MPIYDYRCSYCEHEETDQLVAINDSFMCPQCDHVMDRLACAPHVFTTIVPTYPGAARHKAGSVHKFANRPATKIQIGPGGGLSPDHPKGSK